MAAMTADLIVTNALVVTADPASSVIRDGAVAVTDGRIARLGPSAEVGSDAAEVIDARGMLLMPGLINTHCHAADSLFRGLVEDLPLEPWLQTVWKAEGAILSRYTVRLGATPEHRRSFLPVRECLGVPNSALNLLVQASESQDS